MNYEIITPGEIVYKLKSKPEFLATKHAVHGGLIAAFMDAIVGVASLSAVIEEAKVVATVEFKINYLKAALLNDELTGKGLVISKGNRILVTEGKIFNQRNELIATSIATLNAYPFEKSDMFEN